MAQYRKDKLVTDNYYHIYSRSIAKYKIFNNIKDYERMHDLVNLYRFIDFPMKLSDFRRAGKKNKQIILESLNLKSKTYIDIVAYCFMPTHIHLLLKQNCKDGISKYMGKILNSYARYFNTKYKRNGPLWSGRFKNVLVDDDEQLLHLTRYIHLNPVSAKLIDKPESWDYSSYLEYIYKRKFTICKYKNIINIDKKEYKKFVNDRIDFQRKISLIKNLTIENYSG